MPEQPPITARRFWTRVWPWLVLALAVVPAVWHTVDFPEEPDDEFPRVVRPTFNRRPPPAYRLAEPGDTIDRIGIYFSSVSIVLTLAGVGLSRDRRGLWAAGLGLALAAFWHAATPGPTFDGWHGIGWRSVFDPRAPLPTRLALAVGGLALAGLVVVPLARAWPRRAELYAEGRERGVIGLLVAGLLLIACRQGDLPGVEPAGYWPRWAFVCGVLACNLALLRCLPRPPGWGWFRRIGLGTVGAGAWFALVVGGIWMTWYHRPIGRLREAVPGKIFMCAMPTEAGLTLAHARHHFKTIINLFPEDTPYRSPFLPEELRFARDHGIRYLGSPSDLSSSNAFLDQTLALARDPAAWPILVHCHGCVDRTPAWVGIYRFVVEGKPLDEIMREIERHRGYRPKASVTLLYNRVLPPRAPEHYASDPTARLLKRCAQGTHDPADDLVQRVRDDANPGAAPRVGTGHGARAEQGRSLLTGDDLGTCPKPPE